MLKKLFNQAKKLHELGLIDEALEIISCMKLKYPNFPELYKVCHIEGNIYYDKGDFKRAIMSFREAKRLCPSFELASLSIYLCYKELDSDEQAIKEMKDFLQDYEAELYKTTIEELVQGLQSGYGTAYQDLILELNEKYNKY